MRKTFDEQLDLLSQELTHMGALCETAIASATEALKNRDVDLAKHAIAADQEIDQQEREIERLCLKLLLQQQPVARDLRQISAALKMITDMERIGDQTADIADIVTSAEFNGDENLKDIGRMAEATMKMVRNSVSAYVQKDLELARKVMDADDVVDELFDRIKKELVDTIAEQKGCGGDTAIDLIMITKCLERIGDHATNIAEWVEFSITGIHAGNVRI